MAARTPASNSPYYHEEPETFTYALKAHGEVERHATAIQKLGGVAEIRIGPQPAISLTAHFHIFTYADMKDGYHPRQRRNDWANAVRMHDQHKGEPFASLNYYLGKQPLEKPLSAAPVSTRPRYWRVCRIAEIVPLAAVSSCTAAIQPESGDGFSAKAVLFGLGLYVSFDYAAGLVRQERMQEHLDQANKMAARVTPKNESNLRVLMQEGIEELSELPSVRGHEIQYY